MAWVSSSLGHWAGIRPWVSGEVKLDTGPGWAAVPSGLASEGQLLPAVFTVGDEANWCLGSHGHTPQPLVSPHPRVASRSAELRWGYAVLLESPGIGFLCAPAIGTVMRPHFRSC
jgi:hypothetical protein